MMVQTVRKIVWSDGFLTHSAPFFALWCSFFSARVLTAVSYRELQRCRSRREFYSQVTRHTLAQLVRRIVWTHRMVSSSICVQNNNNRLRQVCVSFFCETCSPSPMVDMWLHGDHGSGAAKRRRDRRLRMHWRHEQLALQMALAAALHHSRDVRPVTNNSLRSQRTARAGRGAREELHGYAPEDPPLPSPPPLPPFLAGGWCPALCDGRRGVRVGRHQPPGGQHRCLRCCRCGFCGAPWSRLETSFLFVPALADSVPQMVDQLVAVLARYDTLIADQVIEVPKVTCPHPSSRCGRTVLCTPQTAEQLVRVPTILYFLKQTVDTRGRSGGPQGFLPEQSSPSTVEQIIDISAPCRGVQRGLQGFSQARSSSSVWWS